MRPDTFRVQFRRWLTLVLLVFGCLLAATTSALANGGQSRDDTQLPPAAPAADLYLVATEFAEDATSGATLVHRYGQKSLAVVPGAELLDPHVLSRLTRLQDPKRVSYRAWNGQLADPDPSSITGWASGMYLLSVAGPIDSEWADTFEERGLEVVDLAEPFGYLVRGSGTQLRRCLDVQTSEGFAVVRGVAPLPLEARIASELLALARGELQPDALGALRGPEGGVLVSVQVHPGVDEQAALDRVRTLAPAAEPTRAWGRDDVVIAEGPELISILHQVEDIAWVEPVYDRRLLNNLAAKAAIVDVQPLWPSPECSEQSGSCSGLDLTGNGVIVGINDSGADPNHVDLQDPSYSDVFLATSGAMSGTDNFHGTHVAGSVLGRGFASNSPDGNPPTNSSGCGDGSAPLVVRGMAWEAQGTMNNIFDGGIGTEAAMMQWSYQQGARLNTNSWGYGSIFGPTTGYTSETVAVDTAVRDADSTQASNQELLILFAAGNDGPSSGTVGAPGNGKNSVTVGASQNDRCGSYIPSQCAGPGINSMACFSSRGPAHQRIKPDVTAPGTDVLSVESPDPNGTDGGWDQGWTGGDYAVLPGTSMATPITAGCTALLFEYHQSTFGSFPSPALGKALLVNGANDMGFGFPSNDQGWGRIDCRQSIEGPSGGQLDFFDQDDTTPLTTGQTFSTSFQCFSTSPRLKVSLVWTDPPGSAGCNPCDVNDLDLVVTDPGGTVYRGNQFTGSWSTPNPGATTDTLNNVENVFVQNPAIGSWTVEVEATSVGTNPPNLSGQDFALAYSGDCADCIPPNAPTGLSATPAFNQVDLSWTGISPQPTEYRIYRGTSTGGPYTQVGTVGGATTSFSDTTVSGGIEYFYVVRAFEVCESSNSNEASTTPSGDCTLEPGFGGVTTVSEVVAGGSCGLRVEWSAGTNNCSGEPLVYNVYRSTSAGFTPAPGNLVASCVTGTAWDDTSVTGGTTYYYTARAEDAQTGGGGNCRDGNEDSGTAEFSGIAGTPTSNTLYSHDFEVGSGLDDWGVAVFGGSTNGGNGGIDWRGIQSCTASSGTDIFRFGGNTCTRNYRNDRLQGAQPADATGIAVPAGASSTQVTFDHRFQFETGFDGGLLAVSLDGTNYTTVASGDLSGTTYNGTASTACPPGLGGAPFFTGTQGTFVTTTASLDNTCDIISGGSGGCAGQTLWISFVGLTDCSNNGDGWFLDDVVVTAETPGACAAPPNAVDFLTATSTSNQNVLEWMNPSAGLYASTMIRWSTAGYPADPTDGTLLVDQNDGSGNHGTTTHSSLTNGTTYYYSAFVDNGSGEYSARKTVAARPFDSSGNVNWAYATGASALTPPAIASIYGVSNDRTLHSMDGSSGGVWPASWSPLAMNGSAQARPPVIPLPFAGATKVAFIGSQDGRVYAADADTGAQLWASGVLGTGLQASPAGYFSGFGGTADLLMIGTRNAGADNELIALDPADGSQTWSYDNGGGASGIGIISGKASVDYANQRVYFASRARLGGSSHTVWALDFTGASATYLWSQAVGDVDGSPILANGRIYVGNLAGEVIALDAATGAVQWTYDAGDGPVKSYVWPRFGTSEILFSTSGNVWSIEDDGGSASLNWSHAAVSNPSAPLVFSVSGTPYAWVGSDDGSLHQLDISGASPVATSVALGGGSATVGTPAIQALTNTLFVGAENGVVYSVDLPLP